MEISRDRRRRAGRLYVGSLVVYFGVATALAVGLGAVSSTAPSIAFGAIQFLVMTAITIFALAHEEDWWNDFRDQNRGMLLGVLGNAITVAVGISVGHLT